MKILLTGAFGFVGTYFLEHYGDSTVTALPRDIRLSSTSGSDKLLRTFLQRTSVVVHLASLAHGKFSDDDLMEFNHRATLELARSAAEEGVSRFVYVSSVGVFRRERGCEIYNELSATVLNNSRYSRRATEIALEEISRATGIEIVIVRSPLVYGPCVKANFLKLIKLAKTAIPLPFGSVSSRRSMIYVGNLVDSLLLCAEHPNAAGEIFLVSDEVDLSIKCLISEIRLSLGTSPRIFRFSERLLRFFGLVIGKKEAMGLLLDSFRVDSTKIRNKLGWVPPYTTKEGIAATLECYK